MGTNPTDPAPPAQFFERVERAKLAGCIAYLLLIPTFMVVAAIIVGMIFVGISALLKLGEPASLVASLVPAGIAMIGAGWFGVRNYRSRNAARVEVSTDFIECTADVKVRRIRFDDIVWLQCYPSSALKVAGKGIVLTLRVEEWPIEKIHEALQARAVPRVAARLREGVLDGRPATFSTPKTQVASYFVLGVILLAIGGAATARYVTLTAKEGSRAGQVGLVLALAVGGAGLIYRGLVERRGYQVSEQGIQRMGDPAGRRDWASLLEGRVTAGQMLLNFSDGKPPFKVSALCRNFSVMVALVKSLTPEEAWVPKQG